MRPRPLGAPKSPGKGEKRGKGRSGKAPAPSEVGSPSPPRGAPKTEPRRALPHGGPACAPRRSAPRALAPRRQRELGVPGTRAGEVLGGRKEGREELGFATIPLGGRAGGGSRPPGQRRRRREAEAEAREPGRRRRALPSHCPRPRRPSPAPRAREPRAPPPPALTWQRPPRRAPIAARLAGPGSKRAQVPGTGERTRGPQVELGRLGRAGLARTLRPPAGAPGAGLTSGAWTPTRPARVGPGKGGQGARGARWPGLARRWAHRGAPRSPGGRGEGGGVGMEGAGKGGRKGAFACPGGRGRKETQRRKQPRLRKLGGRRGMAFGLRRQLGGSGRS